MCPPTWAHWRHLMNTIELVLLSAHPSQQSKWQIDRFSHFCTAHGRKSLYFTMGDPFSPKCPFSWGIWITSNSSFAQLMAECRRAHWHNLVNTIELVLPLAHRSPQPKLQIDWFSHFFCTAHGRKFLHFTMGIPFPQNCPYP